MEIDSLLRMTYDTQQLKFMEFIVGKIESFRGFSDKSNVAIYIPSLQGLIRADNKTDRQIFFNKIVLIFLANLAPGLLDQGSNFIINRNEDQLKVLRWAFAYCVACGDINLPYGDKDLPFGGCGTDKTDIFERLVLILNLQK